jgi:hypothetical protein
MEVYSKENNVEEGNPFYNQNQIKKMEDDTKIDQQ